jgi:c-di-GMP-binding flagellar brake protein YcgR
MSLQERRKAQRIDVDFVTVEIYHEQLSSLGPSEICNVINLSISGMRFISDNKFDSTQTLRLTFVLPESMIVIRINSVIIHQSEAHGKYSYGVHFKNMGLAEQKLIEHFITKSSRA